MAKVTKSQASKLYGTGSKQNRVVKWCQKSLQKKSPEAMERSKRAIQHVRGLAATLKEHVETKSHIKIGAKAPVLT